ncbi:MAG: hypothetical protein OSA45_12750 [Halioglobus sp.]|nr:hypothetical protein [Halioglobus sp.]
MDAEDAGFEQAVKEQDRGDPIGQRVSRSLAPDKKSAEQTGKCSPCFSLVLAF